MDTFITIIFFLLIFLGLLFFINAIKKAFKKNKDIKEERESKEIILIIVLLITFGFGFYYFPVDTGFFIGLTFALALISRNLGRSLGVEIEKDRKEKRRIIIKSTIIAGVMGMSIYTIGSLIMLEGGKLDLSFSFYFIVSVLFIIWCRLQIQLPKKTTKKLDREINKEKEKNEE